MNYNKSGYNTSKNLYYKYYVRPKTQQQIGGLAKNNKKRPTRPDRRQLSLLMAECQEVNAPHPVDSTRTAIYISD